MDLYIEVDVDDTGGPAPIVPHWFQEALSNLFPAVAEWEFEGINGIKSIATITRRENEERERFKSIKGQWGHFLEELPHNPYWATLIYFSGESEFGWVRASSIASGVGRSVLSVGLQCGDEALSNAEYCAWIVDFVRKASNAANPSFGRVEHHNFADPTNLDVGLNRKHQNSLREAREVLRGYAWMTICPSELVAKLGGVDNLVKSGTFYRVHPLDSGGVLLQASETLTGYTDDVMERVFLALAPVLPTGVPKSDPAHPRLRFVMRDASEA